MPLNPQLVLLAWIPIVLTMFALLRSGAAAIWSIIIATLFLPVTAIYVQGIPDLTKNTATSFAVLLGAVLFDTRRLLDIRPRWPDLLVVAWLIGAMLTSINYGQGAAEGFSAIAEYGLVWGLPYVLGRIFLRDLEDLHYAATAMVVSALIYIPFCLFEMWRSPILHQWVYGFSQHSIAQQIRWGGWRPMVFMNHGLMLGFWMCAVAVLAFWLYRARAKTRLGGISMFAVVSVLAVMAVLTRSTGAIALAIVMAALFVFMQVMRTVLPLWLLLAVPLGWVTVRVSGLLHLDTLEWFIRTTDLPRGGSLLARFRPEQNYITLLGDSIGRTLLGRGRFGFRIDDVEAQLLSGRRAFFAGVTDALWLLSFARGGLVEVFCLLGLYMAGPVGVLRSFARSELFSPVGAPLLGFAVIIAGYNVDNLVNAMHNPFMLFLVGGLVEVSARRRASGVPITWVPMIEAMTEPMEAASGRGGPMLAPPHAARQVG